MEVNVITYNANNKLRRVHLEFLPAEDATIFEVLDTESNKTIEKLNINSKSIISFASYLTKIRDV